MEFLRSHHLQTSSNRERMHRSTIVVPVHTNSGHCTSSTLIVSLYYQYSASNTSVAVLEVLYFKVLTTVPVYCTVAVL